jgi:hypothetical protein
MRVARMIAATAAGYGCRMTHRPTFALVLAGFAALTVALAAAAPPASAAVHGCNVSRGVPNRALAHAGVTSVRNMTCAAARRAIHRNGRHAIRAAYRDTGARFALGRWSCKVYLHDYELWKARCVNRGRAFRVDYGY